MVLAIIGTIISVFVISTGLYFIVHKFDINMSFMECLSFAALISSTDPVSTLAVFSNLKVECNLFYLVFGESCLNDAIALTLFKVANRFIGQDMTKQQILQSIITFVVVFISSCCLGYFSGIITALIYRFTNFNKKQTLLNVALYISTVYLPYLLSDALQLSGIVAILFTGIASRRYTNKNISRDAVKMSSFVFKLMAHISETACFAFLGLSVFSLPKDSIKIGFIGITLFLCYIARAAHVYPLLSLINLSRFIQKKQNLDNINLLSDQSIEKNEDFITVKTMTAIFFAGLRGTVAFSCSLNFPTNENRNIVICTTTCIILITLFVQGSITETFLKCLGIPTNVDTKQFEIEYKNQDFERKYLYPLIVRGFNDRNYSNKSNKNEMDVSSGGGSLIESVRMGHDDNDSIEGKSIESLTFSKSRKNRTKQLNPMTIELEEELYRLTRENLEEIVDENDYENKNPYDYGR